MLVNREDFEDVVVRESLGALVDNGFIINYLLSGNSHCRIENMKTGNSFIYKIKKNKDRQNMYFVNVESGLGDIYCGYFYVNAGIYDYHKGAKGNVDENDTRIKVLLYVLNHAPKLPSSVIVEHFGKCGRCGEKIEVVEYLKIGLCPECDKELNHKEEVVWGF